MKQTRAQRFSTYAPIVSDGQGANQDSLSYEPGSSKITIGIFPRFGSLLPDIPKVEISLRSGAKAPKDLPFTRGGYTLREIKNEPFCIYCIGISGGILEVPKGVPPTNYQCAGIVTRRNGEIVTVVTGSGEDIHDSYNSFARYAIHYLDFERNAKPVESKNLMTKVNQVDEITLTHTWSASVRVGVCMYQVSGMVKELREKGAVPNGSFSYWKRAFAWTDGDLVALVAEDFTGGNYHAAVFNVGGQILGSSNSCAGLQNGIQTAFSILEQNRQ